MILGRLERVDLREVWQREANSFTPWLAENLHLIGEAIEMDLALEAVEKTVGTFRADIVARNVRTDGWVLIENQLDRTDHSHLGQILTYATGLKATTVVWIACQFADEHTAALDWLNSVTDENIRFYGLQIELWRIDSSMAPKFNIVSRPNTWIKRGREYKRDVTGGHRERIKQAMLLAVQEQRALDYRDIAVVAQVGYSTVKKYAPEIKQELAQFSEK